MITAKKKLHKLLKNPKQFFFDSRDLRRILRRFGLIKEAEPAASTVKADISTAPSLSTPELFVLVGDNWQAKEIEKPVAILWGVPTEKRVAVSRFLYDYRTAYARGRALWVKQKSVLDQHDSPSIIAWDRGGPPELKAYAKERGIPLYRIEEGFIRSAIHRTPHSTVLSLILDKQGIYFDATRPSDLEVLLNGHDFKSEFRLMRATGPLLRVMRGLRVGQYNRGSLQSPAAILGPKLKHRVLVIGQAKGDASVRHGLAEGWTGERLIELARAENPGADIIYQPHPEVAQDFRANPAAMQEPQTQCRVLAEEVVLADLLKEVDHVYTINSHGGLEALIHGLPVTVVGAPFYAGWGLTDDRVPLPRRTRRLSLEELFCGVYLLYPRYLTDPEDPVRGCLAAMLRVTADRQQHANSLISTETVGALANQIAASDHWPVLFKPEHWPSVTKKYGRKVLSLFPPQPIFARCSGDYYQLSMACMLASKLRGTGGYGKFLEQLKGCLRQQHFAALVTDLCRVDPSDASLSQRAWLAEKCGDAAAQEPDQDPGFSIKKNYAQVLALAQSELKQKNFEEAYRLFNLLLLSGHVQGDVIAGIADIARLRFDFASAAELLKVYNHYDPAWRDGRGHLLEAQAQSLAGDALAALEAMALACKLDSRSVSLVASISDVLERVIGTLKYNDAMLAAYEVDDSGSPLARAIALIASERAADAEQLLLDYTPAAAETLKYCVMLSLAYSYQGKLEQAKQLVVDLLPRYPTAQLYHEGLRLSVLKNDYVWGQALLAEAEARELEIGDVHHRKIALALGDIKGGYLTFRGMRAHKILEPYLGGRYVHSLDQLPQDAATQIAIVALFGPGDEIRFASLYREMRARCGESQVVFTCDPRLLPLLRRHYTDLNFAAVGRIRSLAWLQDYGNFRQLPGSDLHAFFDNAGWALAKNADKVILTTDAVGDVINDYDSFKGTPYLKADPRRIAEWKMRLHAHAGKPLVGLSWRSSLTTYSRAEHYFCVEDIAPVFEVEGAQFVNLQYDDCSEELAWLEQRFPGRMLHFDDLDQYNDLDGVAALMSCLDLIVAPATTVVELAGALGRPTLLLSNSSELHWRKRPGTMTDVWHRSVTHVEGDTLGDKSTLIRALAARLRIGHSSMVQTSY